MRRWKWAELHILLPNNIHEDPIPWIDCLLRNETGLCDPLNLIQSILYIHVQPSAETQEILPRRELKGKMILFMKHIHKSVSQILCRFSLM
jgi:hypothetical protein